MSMCPRYLSAYADLWATDPHAANLAWWKQAGWGLFLHYGLYSQVGRHEWVQHREQIPVAEYARLAESFDPRGFDADAITDLACAAGMTYVNFTTCHHEGFCLWDSKTESFNSKNHGGRDLVRELAEQCDRKGLGFFAYFTHVLNWRHPHALPVERMPMARPAYATTEPTYAVPNDPTQYWAWAHACMGELAKMPAPLAGIWLDLISSYYIAPDLVPIEATYALIRSLRPETLISFKQGATGTEDFASPEFHFRSQGDVFRKRNNPEAAALADTAWAANCGKWNEICISLQKNGWGYVRDSVYATADETWPALAHARKHRCNLLANIAPLPDGSLAPEAVTLLRATGERLRREGMPDPGLAAVMTQDYAEATPQ